MNKRGFTLIELLVYMAIVGVVVIIAGQAFSDSTRIELTSKNMIKANQEAENLGNLFRDDVAQMGAKSGIDSDNEDVLSTGLVVDSNVYMDAEDGDFSSFKYIPRKEVDPLADHQENECPDLGEDDKVLKRNLNRDCLILRKAKYNEDGSILRVEELSWFVSEDGILKRRCKTIGDGTEDPISCPKDNSGLVELASGVTKFVTTPAMPDIIGGSLQMFPTASDEGRFRLISRADDGDKVVEVSVAPTLGAASFGLSNFVTNYRENPSEHVAEPEYHEVYVGKSGEVSDDWRTCQKFSFEKDATYEITFKTPFVADYSRMFRPGLDHLSIGLRTVKDGESLPCGAVEDMMFFPPLTKDSPDSHILRFTSRNDFTSTCIAFTLAFFSPTINLGTFHIADLNLKRISDKNYKFVDKYNPEKMDKANIRAFKMELQIKRNGVTGESVVVVPVPSNGLTE